PIRAPPSPIRRRRLGLAPALCLPAGAVSRASIGRARPPAWRWRATAPSGWRTTARPQSSGSPGLRASALVTGLALAQHAQAQGVQLDEALSVVVVIGLDAFLEGHQVLIVQALVALAADDGDIALVELDPHHARDLGLGVVDGGLQHLALGREPEAVVDQVGVFDRQFVLQVHL